MTEKQKVEFDQLEAGYEFPPSSYKLDASTVSTYLKAVDESSSLYQDTGLVPPMAIVASAMAALAECISMPPGAIHVSQELEFKDTVNISDSLTSNARVNRKQSRGKLHLLVVDLNISNENQKIVLTGQTSFILPVQDEVG